MDASNLKLEERVSYAENPKDFFKTDENPHQPTLPHIIFTAVATDLRKSNIADLQLPQVDFRAETITVVENKTGDTKTLRMNDLLTECLKRIKRVSVGVPRRKGK